MTNRLKHNLIVWIIYAILIYIILIPCQIWIIGISISIILGFFFQILNDILTQVRKLNGEKFQSIEDIKLEKLTE